MICKYFLPFRGLPVHFVGCLCCAKTFYFDVVLLVDFCFCCQIQKVFAMTDVKE